MKNYILILSVFISIKATAQIDSGSYYLPFQIKQKFVKVMVPEEPILLEDKNLMDTLRKAVGSGSAAQSDSVTVVNLKVATYLRLIEKNLMNKNVVAYYAFATEFFTSPLVQNGYSGILPALNYYADFGTVNQKIAAIWMRGKLLSRISVMAALLTDDQNNGFERLSKPRVQN